MTPNDLLFNENFDKEFSERLALEVLYGESGLKRSPEDTPFLKIVETMTKEEFHRRYPDAHLGAEEKEP